MIGATVTCNRSRHRAARNRDTVSAPPSIRISAHSDTRKRSSNRRRCYVPVMRRQSDNLDPARRRAARPLSRDQQSTNAIIGEQSGIGSQAPTRINDGANRLRTSDPSDRQLRIVSDGRPNSDNDNVDQRPQPVKMLNASRAIDIFRMPGSRRDPTVERLPELAYNNQIVYRTLAQGAEHVCPNLRKGVLSVTK